MKHPKGTLTTSTNLNITTRNKLKLIPFIIIGIFLFYQFMTYDRNYNLSKEFEYDIQEIAFNSGFIINQVNRGNVNNIKLPTERVIKIRIQKILNQMGLSSYGHQYGITINLISKKSQANLTCKGWCLDDHLIGIEIEYKNIDNNSLNTLKNHFEKQFSKYQIIWTLVS